MRPSRSGLRLACISRSLLSRPRPPCGQVAVELNYVDGLKGLGVPVNNAVSLDGAIVTMNPNSDGLHLATRSYVLRFGIPIFRRGDYDGSGMADITDAINSLGFLFLGTHPPLCLDAGDVDNRGVLDLTDPIITLECLFLAECPGLLGTVCERDPVESIDPGDGRPIQPAQSLECDTYPSPVLLPAGVFLELADDRHRRIHVSEYEPVRKANDVTQIDSVVAINVPVLGGSLEVGRESPGAVPAIAPSQRTGDGLDVRGSQNEESGNRDYVREIALSIQVDVSVLRIQKDLRGRSRERDRLGALFATSLGRETDDADRETETKNVDCDEGVTLL